jgi:Arylsulfotransferase (ASST)/Bacterial Ig domain/RTX calcium-binding nonapeptide repeat (4 copies)
MKRFCRWVLPIVLLLPVVPTAAQAHSAAGSATKGTGATCFGKQVTLQPERGRHLLVGSPQADVIVGTRGADEIRGRGGNDLICGGGGNDLLAGGPGRDQLRGGAGADFLVGGAGADQLTGDSGDDRLDGGTGFDRCAGNGGANTYVSCEVEPASPPSAAQPDGPAAGSQPAGSNDGGKAPAPIDHLPIAADDASFVGESSGATFIDVLSNDTDSDGDPMIVESVTQPQDGNVEIATDGAGLTYEPLEGYCNDGEASDTFTYTLNGGSEGTVSVKVTCLTTVSVNPAMEPAFDPEVTDYTTRCTGAPLEVSGRTAEGTTVAVDGGDPATGKFTAAVPLEENQAFSFTTTTAGETDTYFVRCLPAGFPPWEYEKLGQPSHQLYVVAPSLALSGTPSQYVVIFDRNGVPVWWDTESPGRMIDAKVLDDGTIAWWRDNHGYIVHDLNGSLLGEINTVLGPTDLHELQQTPNGNYLLISSKVREHIDLSEYGYGPDEEVLDYIVEEVTPQGQLVWSWDTGDHIGLDETGRWWPKLITEVPRDIVHMNAIEPVGENAVLVSLRHTDAVYKIDKSTGEILWKLGGTWTTKSLNAVNDPQGSYPLGGQHDPRLMPDGTITVYDNRTALPSPPRAVRYEIDEAKRTATLVEQVTDPFITSSFCCGSARLSADGSWLMSWTPNSYVAEYDAAHETTFRLRFGGTLFSYRAVPVEDGLLSVSSLRAGMEVMNPR